MDNRVEDLECKLIFNYGVVKSLLRMGLHIVDIKQDKNNKDRTLFAFEKTPEFEKAFAQINHEIKMARENKTQ